MKLLVTGGAGFIGSNFIRHMLRNYSDVEVVNIDNLTYAGNLENLRNVQNCSRYEFVKADIADPIAVECIFCSKGVDAVVNFAAESHVDRSIVDSAPFVHTNIVGTQVLLDMARKHNVSKYVQVSTDEVYGSLEPHDPVFTEQSPLRPNSPYAASKAAADLLVAAYNRTYGLPAMITRCSNNYGPYQFPEKLIPLMITNALDNRQLPIYGDGKNIRDWIHVEDHCAAIDLVLHKGTPGEVYNIGAGCEMPNIDLVKDILQILGKPESLINYVADRLGHDRRYGVDYSKISSKLGWNPKHNLTDDLPVVVDWYQGNEEWWRRVKSGEYLDYYETMYSSRS